MVNKLKDYLLNTPPEQKEKDWNEIEELNLKDSPTLKDFAKFLNKKICSCKHTYIGDGKMSIDICENCK